MHGYDLPNATPAERSMWFAATRGQIEDHPDPATRRLLGALLDATEALYTEWEEIEARPPTVFVPVRSINTTDAPF